MTGSRRHWTLAVVLACGCARDDREGATALQPTTAVLAQIDGTEAFDWVGLSLGAAGDVNGDRKADLFVASLSAGPGGRVGVFFGPLAGEYAIADANTYLTGELTFSNAGQAAPEAGGCDFDGDGRSDLLIGAPFADRTKVETSAAASGDNAGRAYVWFGGEELPATARLDAAHVTFLGEVAYDAAGFTTACLGDLDGDGRDEAGIGAPRRKVGESRGAGALYIVYGRPRSQFQRRIGLEAADAVLEGERAYDGAGTVVAKAGDVDADGRADVLVGAPSADDGGADGGLVYLVTGQRLAGKVALAGIARSSWFGRAGQRLGMAAGRAGDFDGDGKPDLLVGGSPVRAARMVPGEAFLLLGPFAPGRRAAHDVAITLRGEAAVDLAGGALASLDDVTGDGRADIVIGAPGATGGAGKVYFVTGRRASIPSQLELASAYVVRQGGKPQEFVGEVVQKAGDIDGDGWTDLLLSARGQTNEQAAAGSAYVVSGRALGGQSNR